MNNQCIYLHINTVKQEIFYVGKGDINRPYQTRSRNKHWKNITNKYNYQIIIIHENLSWNEACNLEINYINQIGRNDLKLGTLTNLTNGGDGTIGVKLNKPRKPLSQEHKDSIRNTLSGRKHLKTSIDKIKSSLTGKTKSKLTRSRISQTLKNRNVLLV